MGSDPLNCLVGLSEGTPLPRATRGEELARLALPAPPLPEAAQAAADLALQSRILASLGEGVQLTRAADARIIYTNPTFDKMFGYDAGELLGQSVSVLNADDEKSAEETAQVVMSTLHTSGRWEGDILNRRKDGTTFCCHATVTETTHPQHGRVWISVHQDLSRRLQAEREREVLQRKLMEAQRLESLGILAGGIAHDINNYLVLILGSVSLLGDFPGGDATHEEARRQIQAGASQIRDLVQQMLAFAGKGRFVSQAIDVQELISELLPLLRSSISKKLRLHCELGSTLPLIDGDPAQLRQMLINILVNASEAFDGRSGAIRIALSPYRPGDTPLLPDEVQRGVLIDISDNGPGIPDEIIGRIFEPFFSTKATGRGLGLAAVLGIVRSHHGAIAAQAAEPAGMCFRIALPAGKLQLPSKRAPHLAAAPKASDGCVLVVDDEPGVRSVLQLFLQRSGYTTLLAEGGTQALQLLAESPQRIAVVLLDLTMPERSGEEVFQDIRRIAPKLPVIIMSGYNAKAALPPEILADLAGLLTKPFEKADLLQLLQQVLPPRQPSRSQ